MRNTCLFHLPASLAVLGFAFALPACNSTPLTDDGSTDTSGAETPTGDGDGDAPPTTGGDGDALTLYEIQQGSEDGSVGAGQLVNVTGVIVTTPVEAEEGLVFVQESDAGEWSGISLYLYDEVVMANQNLAPGDEVNFVGEFAEFFGMSQIIIKNPVDIGIVSSGNPIPGPDIVAVADVARTNAAAEPWEGVRVCVENAVLEEANDGFGQFVLQGGALVSYAFIGGQLPNAAPGGSFAQICGSLHYNFDEFKIQPASLDDLTGYQAPNAMDTTVMDVQMGVHPEGTVVRFTDVVVSSGFAWSADTETSFFVQDESGGEWSGIEIFVADSTGMSIAPGDVLTLSGTYTEFFDMSQVSIAGSADVTVGSSGPAPMPSIVAAADIATGGAMAENFEGCLVQVGPVAVTNENPDDPDEFGEFAVDGDLRVTDLFFAIDDWSKPALDTAYDSITGVLIYSFSNTKLAPRDANDFAQP